jgi:hypothetical protein
LWCSILQRSNEVRTCPSSRQTVEDDPSAKSTVRCNIRDCALICKESHPGLCREYTRLRAMLPELGGRRPSTLRVRYPCFIFDFTWQKRNTTQKRKHSPGRLSWDGRHYSTAIIAELLQY